MNTSTMPCYLDIDEADILDVFRRPSNGSNYTNCSTDYSGGLHFNSKLPISKGGQAFYVYFTPVILIIGIFGNSLSLNVFLSKNMRSLSASTYLAALSSADLLTLVFYVTVEWLRRGLVHLSPDVRMTFLDFEGVCQIQLYLSYIFRFLSAWIVVAFTVERYIGVCHPLRRRNICTTSGTRRIIIGLIVFACIFVLYKPIMSGVQTPERRPPVCARKDDYAFISFVFDSIFAGMITLVPFIIITVLNLLIIRKLFIRNKMQRECKVITEESIIRLEFTLILLAISFCFIAFNVPYFAVWFRNFLHASYFQSSLSTKTDVANYEYWQGVLRITRTIFYMNYCINFFLYSITGAYFRREVKMLFFYRSSKKRKFLHCSRVNSNSHTPQSWV